jgi:hypothetical protein
MLTTMSNINEIFVFGSNEAGRHGKGAALTAWYNLPPSSDRGKIRSKTFPGFAQ